MSPVVRASVHPWLAPRRVAGIERRISAAGFAVPGELTATPYGRRSAAETLRRIHSAGGNLFDLRGAASLEAAAELLRAALPGAGDELVVLAGTPARSRPSARGPSASPPAAIGAGLADLRTDVSVLRKVLGREVGLLLEVSAAGDDSAAARELVAEGTAAALVTRIDPEGSLEAPPGPGVGIGPLSLLDGRIARRRGAAGPAPLPPLLAEDVLAHGRLDGSRFDPRAGPGAAGEPRPLSRLQADWAPVLALGFLTAEGRRTLLQAAVGFALAWPWVAAALLPLPPPERLEAVLAAGEGLPLAPEELVRLGLGMK